MRGIIEVGFTRLTNFKMSRGHYIYAYRQQGIQTLLDHYVFSKVPSDFIYRVKDEAIEGFAISHDYIHRHVFANGKYEENFLRLKSNSQVLYRKTIYGRVNNKRQEHIKIIKNRGLTESQAIRMINRQPQTGDVKKHRAD